MKCGSLSRTASRSHIVKPGQAHMTHNCTVADPGEGPGDGAGAGGGGGGGPLYFRPN